MKRFVDNIKRLAPSRRKFIQLYTALLFNANLKGFVSGNIYKGDTKKFCAPGINCYSCPGAISACPLGSLQGSFSADRSTLYYVAGILVLYGVLFGRMICGWFCPFGLIQELLHKIPTPKLRKSPITRILSYFKYVVLVFFVFIVPIAYAFKDTPLPAFCKYICPAGTLEGGIGLLSNKVNASYFSMLGPLFTWKFLILVSIVVGSVFVFRLFCRFLCPLGALYGLFNRFSIFGIKINKPACTGCNLCVSHCKMDVLHVGDQECISCGECIDVCPTKAITWKGTGIFLRENEFATSASSTAINTSDGNTSSDSYTEATQTAGDSTYETIEQRNEKMKKRRLACRGVVWVLMIALLIGVIIYYWKDDSGAPVPVPEQNTDVPRGNQIGDLCYNYDLEIITPEGISTETIDPTSTGKITIINFWGTWCTPCVNELPYFDRIASEYADSVTVVAVHTNMVSDTAPDFIGEYYPDSKIIFARDYATGATEGYYSSLGGRGTYPYTVILDENGIIAAIFVSSLTYEDLKTVVEELLK